MKKILLTAVGMLSLSILVSAQEMGFEETVKYIREKMECCRDKSFYRAVESVTKDGKMKVTIGSDGVRTFDLFELFPDDTTRQGMAHGSSPHSIWYNHELIFLFETEADGKRMLNALRHLKTICVKPKDVFD